MIIDKIRNYFLSCPLIDEFAKINVDYLGVDEVQYTIDSVPTDTTIKKYVDGGALKQYVFVFGSREYYGADTIQNLENSGFYEKFSEWINTQNEEDNFPLLEGNKVSNKMEVLTSGYLFDSNEEMARYQIQMRLVYYENK